MSMKEEKQLNMYISVRLHGRLKLLAAVKCMSMKEMVEGVLEKYVVVEMVNESIKLEEDGEEF